jgi:hypothetical protein
MPFMIPSLMFKPKDQPKKRFNPRGYNRDILPDASKALMLPVDGKSISCQDMYRSLRQQL